MFEKIYYNLYSYSFYAIIGIIIVSFINKFLCSFIKNEKSKFFIISIISILLPFCNCISICYLLLNLKEEYLKVNIFILSTFLNISAIIMILLYFGKIFLIIYLFMILIFLLLNTYFSKVIFYKRISLSIVKSNDDILSLFSKFIFIHFIGLLIMSSFQFILSNNIEYSFLSSGKIDFLFFAKSYIINYTCIPDSIRTAIEYYYQGLSIIQIFNYLFIGTVLNIIEFILMIKYNKCFLSYILSAIIVNIVGAVLIKVLIVNIDFNFIYTHSESWLNIANKFNVAPSNLFRNISIFIYLIFIIVYIMNYIKKFLKRK